MLPTALLQMDVIVEFLYVFGPCSAVGGISLHAAATFINIQLTGSVNFIGSANLSDSVMRSDGNTVYRCRARSLFLGAPKILAAASFKLGGGISISFGFVAFSQLYSEIQTGTVTFLGVLKASGNMVAKCSAVLSIASAYILSFDPLVFGGGISLFVGPHIFGQFEGRAAAFVNFTGTIAAEGKVMSRCHAVVNFAA